MKCIILAGGYGTRLAEETQTKPKPMVKIGRYPILWHIMKLYAHHGINDFIICLGYKGFVIKNYLKKNFVNSKNKKIHYYKDKDNNWKITCVNTGIKTNTGGRLLKLNKIIKKNEDFCFTYGDGLTNVNIRKAITFFKKTKKIACVTAAEPPAKYGVLKIKNNLVTNFTEKIDNKKIWINGGFFIFNSEIFNFIKDFNTSLEFSVLPKLVKKKQLCSYKHYGYWQSMDTLRDKMELDKMWRRNEAPWKIWKK
jgi:glucose-1-phosphate cytidylyltransferase